MPELAKTSPRAPPKRVYTRAPLVLLQRSSLFRHRRE